MTRPPSSIPPATPAAPGSATITEAAALGGSEHGNLRLHDADWLDERGLHRGRPLRTASLTVPASLDFSTQTARDYNTIPAQAPASLLHRIGNNQRQRAADHRGSTGRVVSLSRGDGRLGMGQQSRRIQLHDYRDLRHDSSVSNQGLFRRERRAKQKIAGGRRNRRGGALGLCRIDRDDRGMQWHLPAAGRGSGQV